MKISTSTISIKVDDHVNDLGDLIGKVYHLDTGGTTRYVTEAHDWDTDETRYDPIIVAVFDDPAQAVTEIEQRARQATHADYVTETTF